LQPVHLFCSVSGPDALQDTDSRCWFPLKQVLRGVSVTLEPGSSMAFVGSSGSGEQIIVHSMQGPSWSWSMPGRVLGSAGCTVCSGLLAALSSI